VEVDYRKGNDLFWRCNEWNRLCQFQAKFYETFYASSSSNESIYFKRNWKDKTVKLATRSIHFIEIGDDDDDSILRLYKVSANRIER